MSAMPYDIWAPKHTLFATKQITFTKDFKNLRGGNGMPRFFQFLSSLTYDIFCHLCHMSAMTYENYIIWQYGCLENRQDLSNAAPGFTVIQKVIFMHKNWKNLGIPFPPLKFSISFVKCMGFVGDLNGMGILWKLGFPMEIP